jgi:hypothetical protein
MPCIISVLHLRSPHSVSAGTSASVSVELPVMGSWLNGELELTRLGPFRLLLLPPKRLRFSLRILSVNVS